MSGTLRDLPVSQLEPPNDDFDSASEKQQDAQTQAEISNQLEFEQVRGKSAVPFRKVLCCNRGEIAVRVFRACHDLSIRTVAIYSHEDRLMSHRTKADEAFEISGPGITPVGAYLNIERVIAIAKKHDVDAIHPGYGFLSENADLVKACDRENIVFVGPTAAVVEMMGDKTLARQAAIKAGVSVVPGSDGPVAALADAELFVEKYGLPIIIKAAFGGGGRGMRVVKERAELEESFARASSEAAQAFGNGTVFLEKYIETPRHIEVQILADNYGNVVHLFERDCSVQRRHQKVVEMAPAQKLPAETRANILKDAVALCKAVGYRNAGTVEFLVDKNGGHYFIEVNPRIQVEHTVTEEITGVDLVCSQIEIAGGKSLEELGLLQESITCQGFAIQCRVTTEDPARGFRPDTGTLDVYRSCSGAGIRLDGAQAQGAFISPHYDSLLVKVTARGKDFRMAVRRIIRALTEFRIRGVKTNIPFLQKLFIHPRFLDNDVSTMFIEQEAKALFEMPTGRNRGQKVLVYLANVAVNGAQVEGAVSEVGELMPIIPQITDLPDPTATPPEGLKQLLDREGPEAYARAVRNTKGLLITDTTWRDAHQSLLMTRMRTYDIARVAPQTAHILAKCASLECWGGATFDVCLRFLKECPWRRLQLLRRLVPNVPFQMLLRGANAVGYTSYPDNVVYQFVKLAKEAGVDIFRIFDSLNYIENLELGIDAVRKAGGVIEAAICYTGDISSPGKSKYTLEYYMALVDRLVELGTHILGIKDMAGLLKPEAARQLVGAIRAKYPDLPIHVHTHDTAGTGVASMLAAAQAGADIVDAAIDAMSGLTSQPSMGAIVASVMGTPLDTGLNINQIQDLNDYWQQVRELYRCFDPGLKSGSCDVYLHEMPGGQYTNLLFQSRSLGLGDQWPAIKRAYAEANQLMGDVVKVTPSSKVCGDLAQFMVQNKLTGADVRAQADKLNLPQSVVMYFQGYLGIPPGGFDEKLRSQIVKNLPCITGRPGAELPALDIVKLRNDLKEKYGVWITKFDVMSSAMYPKVFDEFATFTNVNGDVSVLDTQMFLKPLELGREYSVELEMGKTLFIKMVTVSRQASTSGTRDVFFELNGTPRRITVGDLSSKATSVTRPKADQSKPGEVGAPMSGAVVEIRVKEGHAVVEGDPICVLNAMKMETVVSASISGMLTALKVAVGDSINAGDLVAVISAAASPPRPSKKG